MGENAAEGSDVEIYTDLARVNLFRMRGDYKSALDHCRQILRKFPNNVTANQLLGDLCMESGDIEQAKEWYELALDIAPNSAQIQKKLADARQKLEKEETEGLVEQLGLPPSKPKNGLVALGLAGLVIVVGIAAYFIGSKMQNGSELGAVKRTSVNAPISTPPDNTGGTTGSTDPNTTNTSIASAGSTEEQSLLQLVAQKSSDGGKVKSLITDPRIGQVVLSYEFTEGENERLIAANLAGTVFDNHPTARIVTLRAIKNGVVSYVADARKEAYEETKTEAWKGLNGTTPEAVAKHILTQEWPAANTTETQTPPATTAGDASSTTAGTGDVPSGA